MAYKASMHHALLFLDPLHICKNMIPHIGLIKTTAMAYYVGEVYILHIYPTTTKEVDVIKTSYFQAHEQ